MAAIFKIAKKLRPQSGFVLVTSVFIMLLILSLALYVTSFTLTEMRISDSQKTSVQTYYLAEAGVAEAIWKIKNDPAWKTAFETNPSWSIDYTRNPALYSNGSYKIQIQNTGNAKGEITVTAKLNLGLNSSQRVIKTSIFKALGESVIGTNAEYADGNIDMSGSVLHVWGGGLFSNNNIIINYESTINVDKDINAVGNVNINKSATVVASSTHAANYPPKPSPIAMPSVSFNTAGDANSLKARASHIYTANQFSDLLWANRGKTTTLNGITYVTGDVDIKADADMVINGALVADGDITLGTNTLFCCWNWYCGDHRANVTVNREAGTTTPSGIFSQGQVNMELCLGNLNIQGLVYAANKINMFSFSNSANITGGVASWKLTLTSLWQGINIIYDNPTISYGLGNPQFSPIVTVDHWEEEY